ncbi:MAG: 50S ribosomal protein L11 methyltransferase [Burkholderiales bacterium]|nr:50S ribosomal protein L11 methyltransferase [Burkholderiales bacterium]
MGEVKVSWVRASFELAVADPEPIADALLEAGAVSVELTDPDAGTGDERALFGEPGATVAAWPRQRMTVLFTAEADAQALIVHTLNAFAASALSTIVLETVAEQDWVRATQQQFGPIRISERLWIVPSWAEPPDPAAISLRLDPGLAFGTGSHPTTRQCLHWLEQHLPQGASLVDYGCGSGILAIAAKRLGAGNVLAVDIDEGALFATRSNAVLNAVEISVLHPDTLRPDSFDVVVANILSNPLKVLAPLLAGLTRMNGHLVLAGILGTQAEEVALAYRPWFDLQVASEVDGWTCLSGCRTR